MVLFVEQRNGWLVHSGVTVSLRNSAWLAAESGGRTWHANQHGHRGFRFRRQCAWEPFVLLLLLHLSPNCGNTKPPTATRAPLGLLHRRRAICLPPCCVRTPDSDSDLCARAPQGAIGECDGKPWLPKDHASPCANTPTATREKQHKDMTSRPRAIRRVHAPRLDTNYR